MAEFIPQEYRVKVLTRHRMERWVFFGVLVAAFCTAALSSAYALELRNANELNGLRTEQQARASLLSRSQDLHGKRVDLAERMGKIQRLMDDRVLLALLHDLSAAFTENDRLESVHIELSGNKPDAAKGTEGQLNEARLMGITDSPATLSALMTRLGRNTQQPVEVQLENSHREKFLDEQVMRFQLICTRLGAAKS